MNYDSDGAQCLFFYTNQKWSGINLVNNNDNGNDIYNDDHINKVEWDCYSVCCHFRITVGEVE